MAERPIFLPTDSGRTLVRKISVQFTWNSGMSISQKRKNVRALHEAALLKGISPILEVSTKSETELGRHLSAFSLTLRVNDRDTSVESAYQGSKVFLNGGPFHDLYLVESREAKRDERLRSYGGLVSFDFGGERYPLTPPTAFYDWLYINAVARHPDWKSQLVNVEGFTDIEFNPERSLNCQARSCAMFVALEHRGELDDALDSFGVFSEWVERVAI